jgi:hypothetical protein
VGRRNRPPVLVLAALVLVLATPVPKPTPQPTNPFTLDPIPATPLPVIGTTRSRALCTAFRRAIGPAVKAAMDTDKTYSDFRTRLYDYTVYGTETSRDLKLMQMDHQVQGIVKSVDDLETALNSHNFDAPPNAAPKDAEALTAIRKSLRSVLDSQKVQLDAMSGFVETERMSRFGKLNETEANMQSATNPNTVSRLPQAGPTDQPTSHAFLQDSSVMLRIPPGKISLDTAHKLDRDLADLAAVTSKREDAATKVIVPATQLCKPQQ